MVSEQAILGCGRPNQINTSHQQLMKMMDEVKELLMKRASIISSIINSSSNHCILTDEHRPPPAPPHQPPELPSFYTSELSPTILPQIHTPEFSAPQVFDGNSVRNFSPPHTPSIYTSPYTLTIQTTLSTGQSYYVVEPTTNLFGDPRYVSNCLDNRYETSVAEINMKIDGKEGSLVDDQTSFAGETELGVEKHDKSICETISDIYEIDGRIKTDTEVVCKVEVIHEIETEITSNLEVDKDLKVVMEKKVVMKYVPSEPVKEDSEVKKSCEKKLSKQKLNAQPNDQAKGVSKLPQPKESAYEVNSGIISNLNSQATFLELDSGHGIPLRKTIESKSDVVTIRSLLEVMKFDPSHDWGDVCINAEGETELINNVEGHAQPANKKPKCSFGLQKFELTKILCRINEFVLVPFCGMHLHIDRFIQNLKPGDLEKAQLGLDYNYRRAKVKFNINRAENMEYVSPSSPLPMFGNSELNDNFCVFIKKKLRVWCQLQNRERKSGQIQSLSTETANVLLANGSGGNNQVIEHYKETGYPRAVKLGTITSDLEGADVFCYPEDESVLDPHLAQHLDFFGVAFSSLQKTEMTTAERELDQNTNFDWNWIQESGQEVEPLWIFDPGGDTFDPGGDTFDPGERNILATSASDRSIALYDLRMSSPAKKLIMRTRTNSIAWNPREPMNFTAANEDSNCYSYDARKLNAAKCVHKDHVSAVMDIDYSPTGREFVTGSYDRTLRIFQYNSGQNREIYHTKKLQRVFCVKFSGDASYVISGSDDTNLRLWKA